MNFSFSIWLLSLTGLDIYVLPRCKYEMGAFIKIEPACCCLGNYLTSHLGYLGSSMTEKPHLGDLDMFLLFL
jgi:hypothetical protein